MRQTPTGLSFSPTDLASFSGCSQRTLLDRLRALELAKPELFPDPRMDLIKERGILHEQALLEQFRTDGKDVLAFDDLPKDARNPEGYAARAAETLTAMQAGHDVIYQGAVYDGRWLGFVDFLLRVDRPSDLGAWSYEVADAKLTREAKVSAILQTCVYSELIGGLQGVDPEHIHLYLGGPSPRRVSYRLAHFAAYYRALKARFLGHVAGAPDDPPVAPDPVELCRICDWDSRCKQERREVDHLSLVAGIAGDQRRALEGAGVHTLADLARLPLDPPPAGLRAPSFQRIREQARVQLEGRTRGTPHHELRPLESNPDGGPLGLAALPAPTPHDLFFDFEGADYAYEEGLEYLWGISDVEDRFQGDWALTQDQEKACLDRFLAMAARLMEEHPGAHIYHFGHYEPTALKRLVGRYGIRTQELDRLLTQGVFVDLHRIVKQGVVASVESYSIKALEAHTGFTREVPMAEANPARGRLEYALSAGFRDDLSLADRPVVERYNRDDCVSTRALRDWLEGLRGELERAQEHPIPRPTPPEPRPEPDDSTAGAVRETMDALLAGVPEERDARGPEQQVRWLAAHLLEWHRREDKSVWWDFFRLRELPVEDLVEESRPLAGLEYIGEAGTVARSILHRFRFPTQEHRLDAGDKGIDPHLEVEGKNGGTTNPRREIHAIDDLAGTLDVKVGKGSSFDPEALRALIPDDIIGTNDHRARLLATAQRLLEGEASLAAWSPASPALLRRTPPRFTGGATLADIAPEGSPLERATEAVVRLEPGVLPVQGPPGTGKTYTGARMIRALLRDGLTVGVTGPSHKVITNLLDAVCGADGEDREGGEPTPIHGVQVTRSEGCTDPRFTQVESGSHIPKAAAKRAAEGAPTFNLIAGTSWVWAGDSMLGSVDVLFIDEAGQFSLANALAVAPAAPRLVLLGDPQQLNQPQKGIHPPGAQLSVLEHLAGEDGVLDPEQGLFLGETWRMRPEITAFTSELFYGGRLRSRDDLSRQTLTLPDGTELQGLHLVEVPHHRNTRESVEEARAVAELFQRLLGGGTRFTDRHGQTRPLALDDILVVAPYNAQVTRIQTALDEAGFQGARVGTVDKFQGQEAPVALYSLASSSAEDAPRGMDFLYALDRLNVATSRARVATVIVAAPALLTAECKRPEQMRQVNALVRFGEVGGEERGVKTDKKGNMTASQ